MVPADGCESLPYHGQLRGFVKESDKNPPKLQMPKPFHDDFRFDTPYVKG